MKRRLRSQDRPDAMTLEPLVDVVFQLLVFFLFTFQVRLIERLYWAELPAVAPEARSVEANIQVRLLASDSGQLAALTVDGVRLETIEQFETLLRQRLVEPKSSVPRVLLRPQGQLRFAYVMRATLAAQRAGCQPSLMPAESPALP